MKSKVTLYKGTFLDVHRNNVIESISDYLSSFTGDNILVINDVQWQRANLKKTLKLNLPQNYSLIFGNYDGTPPKQNKWNYCMIENPLDDEATSFEKQYYFIIGYKQIAESTVELELQLDSINTCKYNTDYKLSKKSLITREHKNRIAKKTLTFYGEYTGISYDQEYSSGFNMTSWTIKSQPHEELIGATIVDSSVELFPESGVHTLNYFGLEILSDGTIRFFVTETGNIPLVTIRAEIHLNYTITKTYRVVDQYQEGIDTFLFKKLEEDLLDADKYRTYYLIYKTLNNVVQNTNDTEATYVNPIKLELICDDEITFTSSSATPVSIYAYDSRIPKVNNVQECIVIKKSQLTGGAYININGTQYVSTDFTKDYILIRRKNNTDVLFWQFANTNKPNELSPGDEIASNFDKVIFYGIDEVSIYVGWDVTFYRYYSKMYIGSASSSEAGTTITWNSVNASDSKLIKAFNFPYSPNTWMVGKTSITHPSELYTFNGTDYMMELNDAHINDFDRQIDFGNHNPIKVMEITKTYTIGQNRDDYFESKIYHSDFYQPKFVYDSFGFSYHLENIDLDTYLENFTLDKLLVRYVVSGNCLSRFMFQFVQYVCSRSTQDYENVMIVDRNNEKALFTNAYINYIKNGGFAYDTKKANSQNAMNGLMTALSVVGSVVSFASTPYTGGMGIASGVGLALGATSSVIRNIHSAQEQDRAISQKMLQLSAQATSVQGSEDIDILKAFSNNKMKLCYYEPSNTMKQAILDLFYYCGYATHEQKRPTINTRKYFNFVQGEVLLEDYNFDESIAEDIMEKFKQGITFFHKVSGAWDLNQEKENFEISY